MRRLKHWPRGIPDFMMAMDCRGYRFGGVILAGPFADP